MEVFYVCFVYALATVADYDVVWPDDDDDESLSELELFRDFYLIFNQILISIYKVGK